MADLSDFVKASLRHDLPEGPIQPKLMDLWRDVSSMPLVTGGRLLPAGQPLAEVTLEVKDIDNNAKTAFARTVRTDADAEAFVSPPLPVQRPSSVFFSPSGGRSARFVPVGSDGDSKIEVWGRTSILATVSLKGVCKAVLFDTSFQHVSWNEDETGFVFAAERRPDKAAKLWDVEKPSADVSTTRSSYERRENWGEIYSQFSQTTILYCDIARRTVVDLVDRKFTEDFSATMPEFLNDKTVVFAAYSHNPRRLGLAHCYIRKNSMRTVPISGEGLSVPSEPLLPELNNARNIRRFGNKVVFVSSAPGSGAHLTASALRTATVTAEGTLADVSVVVPVVETVASPEDFPGLYTNSGNDLFWIDSGRLLVQSTRRSCAAVYLVDLAAGSVTRVFADAQNEGTWRILDTRGNSVLLTYSRVAAAPAVYFCTDVVTSAPTVRRIMETATPLMQRIADRLATSVLRIDSHDAEVIHHTVADGDKDARPTMIFVHGGPHATDTNMFTHQFLFYLLSGMNIASVNYGGSLGFGQSRVDELCGKIGTNDVADVVAAVELLKAKSLVNPDKLYISGGSHGGFLTAQMTSRYPNMFIGASMRNPVTCLSSMIFETDIPDWCRMEVGVDSYVPDKMWAASPMSRVGDVITPTIIGLGLGDLRVPPSQGIAWFNEIRCNGKGTTVRLLEYPEVGHSLDAVQTEADFAVHSAAFLLACL